MEWFIVQWDEKSIFRRVSPPGGPAWRDMLHWSDIVTICFEAGEDFLAGDTLYLFTRQRQESYAIPMAARGADLLWDEIIRRGLFDAQWAIQAAVSGGGLFCWPPPEGNE